MFNPKCDSALATRIPEKGRKARASARRLCSDPSCIVPTLSALPPVLIRLGTISGRSIRVQAMRQLGTKYIEANAYVLQFIRREANAPGTAKVPDDKQSQRQGLTAKMLSQSASHWSAA